MTAITQQRVVYRNVIHSATHTPLPVLQDKFPRRAE